MVAAAPAQTQAPTAPVERARCHLTSEAIASFVGETGEFFILLPEHINLLGGELSLVLHSSAELWPAVERIEISVNGRKLPAGAIAKDQSTTDATLRARAAVP